MKLTTRLLFCLSIAFACCTTDPSKNKQQLQQKITETALNAEDMRKSDRIDALMQTLLLAEEAGIQDSLTALIYHQAAIYWYKKADNQSYQKAVGLFDKALTIRKKVLQPNDVIFAKNYLNIGKCQKYLLMFSPAIDNFNKTRQHYQLHADTLGLMEVYRELGETYDEIGDYTLALNYFKESANLLSLTDKNRTEKQDKQLAQTYYLEGISNINFRKFPQAEDCFFKALPILERLEDSIRMARVFHELGMTKRFEGQFSEAFNLLNQALQYNMSEKEEIETHIEIVKTHLAAKQLNEAQNCAKQVLAVSKQIDKKQLSEIYEALGTIKTAQQEVDSALFFYQKALQALVPDFKNDDVLLNPSINPKTFNRKIELINVLAHKIGLLSILYEKAKNQRCLEAALQTCLLADRVVQVLRRDMHDDQSKYFWNETALPIYRKGIDIAAQLYTINPKEAYQLAMLQFAERTKAPVLREGIADNQAKDFAGVPAVERQHERELQATIAILEQQTATNSPEIAEYLIKTRSLLYAFQDSLKTKYPTYARYLDASIQDRPLSIGDLKGIQNKLSDSTLLIEYAFGETDLYEIAISNIDFKIFKKPFSPVVNTKIDRFIQSVSDDSLRKDFNAASRAYAETSFDLYQYLLETPLTQTAHSPKQTAFKRIHLVLEGPLQLLPFKALTDQRVEGFIGDYTQHFLVRQYAFSTLFSSQTLLQKTIPSVSALDTAHLKLACFVLDFKDSMLWHKKQAKTVVSHKKNNVLPYAESEGTNIKQQFNGRLFLNETATKNIFIKEAPNYDILHITTHGDPNGLVFQKTNPDDTLDEVTNSDIYGLSLHTQLTFLSACETGQGKLMKAESVMSLGRAFIHSGSQAVIMSLWSVPDYSTSKIAQQFYTYYHQGLPKDIAEQRAELYFLDQEAKSAIQLNPHHWAFFTVNGDMSPLETTGTSSKWWIWVLLGLLSMVGFYIYQKKVTAGLIAA